MRYCSVNLTCDTIASNRSLCRVVALRAAVSLFFSLRCLRVCICFMRIPRMARKLNCLLQKPGRTRSTSTTTAITLLLVNVRLALNPTWPHVAMVVQNNRLPIYSAHEQNTHVAKRIEISQSGLLRRRRRHNVCTCDVFVSAHSCA